MKARAAAKPADPVRELKIKTGVVKRFLKELETYHKEAAQQAAKIDSMKQAGTFDEHDIKKQEEVLGESRAMIDHVRKSLVENMEELKRLVAAAADDGEIAAKEEFLAAKALTETDISDK